jgi:WhiB family redox-sensing transcriptional regulator
MDGATFFHPWNERGPARDEREQRAKAICATCPVIAECAAHALAVREAYGVWGGLTEHEREAMLRRGHRRSWVETADRPVPATVP